MQAAPPTLPFMSRVGRNIEMRIDTRFFECVGILFWITTEASGMFKFPAAIADKHKFDFLFESGRIINIIQTDAAAAEDANIRE